MLEGEGFVGISGGESLPCWGGDEGLESVQPGEVAHEFPAVMGWVGVGRRPLDAEEEAWGLGAGAAGGIHVDLAVQNAIHQVSVTVDVVPGVADGFIR